MRLLVVSSLMTVTMLFAEVSITTSSFQKVKSSGKTVWQKAKKVVPGTVVRYVNTVHNKEKSVARHLVIKNRIPKYTEYVKGSAKCAKPCKITYSIDDGKHFDIPSKLYLRDKKTKKRRRARANEYTAIRWVIDTLNPGEKTTVEYRVRLK